MKKYFLTITVIAVFLCSCDNIPTKSDRDRASAIARAESNYTSTHMFKPNIDSLLASAGSRAVKEALRDELSLVADANMKDQLRNVSQIWQKKDLDSLQKKYKGKRPGPLANDFSKYSKEEFEIIMKWSNYSDEVMENYLTVKKKLWGE